MKLVSSACPVASHDSLRGCPDTEQPATPEYLYMMVDTARMYSSTHVIDMHAGCADPAQARPSSRLPVVLLALLLAIFVMSHSVIYEMIEWVAALIVAPELGNAYLGTQGDQWDAQQDMALATLGCVLSMLFLRLRCVALSRRAH